VIRKIDNEDVTNPNALRNKVAMTSPGTEVTLTIVRDGKEQQIKVKLGELRGANERGGDSEGQEEGLQGTGARLGITVQPLTPEIARQLGLPRDSTGLVVADVAGGGPAAEAGMRPGDIIVQANRQEVKSTADLQKVLGRGGPTVFLMNRQGRTFFLTLRA
jgi:serine protease Do